MEKKVEEWRKGKEQKHKAGGSCSKEQMARD